MDNPDLPQDNSPGYGDDGNPSNPGFTGRSRLEKVLGKGSLWKKQTLRNMERAQEADRSEADRSEADRSEADNRDHDTNKMARMFVRMSTQLDERNDEIERLQQAISKLENEKSQLDRAHQREVDLHQTELERLQDAYDQFEKESDSLLSELGEQNERLLDECRHQNGRSLLKF